MKTENGFTKAGKSPSSTGQKEMFCYRCAKPIIFPKSGRPYLCGNCILKRQSERKVYWKIRDYKRRHKDVI